MFKLLCFIKFQAISYLYTYL